MLPVARRLAQSEGLRAAAEHLEGTELAFVSPHLLALAAWGYLDAAAIGALSLLTLLLGTALIRGMLNYKRDREIEGEAPVGPFQRAAQTNACTEGIADSKLRKCLKQKPNVSLGLAHAPL